MEDIVTQRVNEFRQSLGLSILAFSKEININQTTLNKQLKEGGCGVQVSTLTQILDTYPDLSAEWLLRGEGDMKKGEEWKVTQFIPIQNKDLVEALNRNIALLERLNKMQEERIKVLEAEKKATPRRMPPKPATTLHTRAIIYNSRNSIKLGFQYLQKPFYPLL